VISSLLVQEIIFAPVVKQTFADVTIEPRSGYERRVTVKVPPSLYLFLHIQHTHHTQSLSLSLSVCVL
jgi:hypothetical protein